MRRKITLKKARARKPPKRVGDGVLTKLEQQYAEKYADMIAKGELLLARYEEETLRLGTKCTYTPDWKLIYPDGKIQFVELKAFWQGDARVKWKLAAEKFKEYEFVAVTCKHSKGMYVENKVEVYQQRDGWA